MDNVMDATFHDNVVATPLSCVGRAQVNTTVPWRIVQACTRQCTCTSNVGNGKHTRLKSGFRWTDNLFGWMTISSVAA